jgi:nucleotide-binding universal stress UspA family protein
VNQLRFTGEHFKISRAVVCISLIANILYPVDFSPSCIAIAPYVKRAAALPEGRVSLVHVVDPAHDALAPFVEGLHLINRG